MNVAEDACETGFVESDALGCPRGVHAEVELPPVPEGKHVVKDLVVVGKLNCRADTNDENRRLKAQIPLIEDHLGGLNEWWGSLQLKPYD
jgi:hypothetical protein